VNVARLLADAAAVRTAILTLGPDQFRAFDLTRLPQVHYDPAVAAQAVAPLAPDLDPAAGPGHW
jgi:hypothetical protein